ncbi:hypothetical protein COLO4_35207 [Corchorus olitorius]|uniref:DUF7870 domain-containing protein n=1 Tax=Corchorus olitorius TaxID=93759 RepID=A0A1R3GHS7_9ROSI|nr:hypothetical protein COLO4_35207 [Corchorus olitorius]
MGIQIVDGLPQTILSHNKNKLLGHLVMVLGLFIVLLPWLGLDSIVNNTNSASFASGSNIKSKDDGSVDSINLELLPLLFHDLNMEGIMKMGDKGLLLSNDDAEAIQSSLILRKTDMEFVSLTDLERQSSIPDKSFDLAFTLNFKAASEFIDRTLKVGGIVAVQLSGSPSLSFQKPSNYRIVYFRKFQSTVMVMRKVDYANSNSLAAQRRLFGYTAEAKKAALRQLEDVLLEPPRAASRTSKTYQKRTKYLPDLLGDTLESYSRRVFIDVGLPEKDGGSGTSWFANNYPTRNLKFDMYKIETLSKKEVATDDHVAEIGMSDWLRKNVKEGEFVVMKAEAEVVEDLVRNKVIGLVDELFLECKPQTQGLVGRKNMSKRAYWECLALYGKLRDEGVAVHQWWG